MSEQRKGELFVFLGGILWAVFPILVSLSYAKVPALVSLGWSSIFAAAAFVPVIFYKKSWNQLKNSTFWKYILYIAFFNGLLFYGFYFLALEKTTPDNVALIGLLEVFTSFLFFNILKKEVISLEYKIGAALMLLGGVIVLSKNFNYFNLGDFFMILAVSAAPFGNYMQQKVMKIASSETLLFGRYIITAPIIFLLAFGLNREVNFTIGFNSFYLILINGVIILGIAKIFWVEAIHRISVTKAISLSSLNPLLTLLLSWFIIQQAPTLTQLTSFIPLFIGVLLLTDNLRLKFYEPLP